MFYPAGGLTDFVVQVVSSCIVLCMLFTSF